MNQTKSACSSILNVNIYKTFYAFLFNIVRKIKLNNETFKKCCYI